MPIIIGTRRNVTNTYIIMIRWTISRGLWKRQYHLARDLCSSRYAMCFARDRAKYYNDIVTTSRRCATYAASVYPCTRDSPPKRSSCTFGIVHGEKFKRISTLDESVSQYLQHAVRLHERLTRKKYIHICIYIYPLRVQSPIEPRRRSVLK
jgi:hypothetical protein